jgi:7-cyano-7-deazaguanine synthase in queuosine biosynthesis
LGRVACLTSGGLDSCVLVSDLARDNEVFPIYIQYGLTWEEVEKATLASFLSRLAHPNVRPLTLLELPVRALYGSHWSTTGQGVPGTEADNDADYLPGRNIFMLGLAATCCATSSRSASAPSCTTPSRTPRPSSSPTTRASCRRR